MASMAKLYPPVIANTIPAFYEEDGTVKITVPFSMSRAVSESQIEGFRLKVKTAQSNTYILSLDSTSSINSAMLNGRVTFTWKNTNEVSFTNHLKLGLFYKFQLAYLDRTSHQPGYFSNVAIGKFTSFPNVYIQDATVANDPTGIAIFRKTYLGVFEAGEDQSERPYSYNFYLYDDKGLLEESGWQLHNTISDAADDERLQLTITSDKYTYKTTLKEDTEYYIQYGVRTINELEVFSPMYPCIEPMPQNSQLDVDLIAENIFEEGYVNLHMQVGQDELAKLRQKVNDKRAQQLLDEEITQEDLDQQTAIEQTYTIGQLILRWYDSYSELLEQEIMLSTPVSIEVCRAEKTDNYSSWILLRKAYFSSYLDAQDWSMKDFTIEQGITYKYCIREYNKNGLYTQRILSEPIVADFEDMFLFDGERQLKIRFNPKMSSFKATKLEQKLDTIGSKYPFIFKNGVVDYKEFPISGLISYKVDNNELFINHKDDLNILLGKYPRRLGSPANQATSNGYDIDMDEDNLLDEYGWKLSETLDSVGYNIRAERRFKLKVLEWLNNSEVKLFRTPTEGSYLVRLMNISMSPEDRLGRMLHNFSCQAYEVDELNYDNLLAYGFINLTEIERTKTVEVSRYFTERIPVTPNFYDSFKINAGDIQDFFSIQPSSNTQFNQIYVRIGSDMPSSKTLIIGQKGLTIKDYGNKLPDIYFNPSDNESIINPDQEYPRYPYVKTNSEELRNALFDIFGASINNPHTGLLLTYNEKTLVISSGEIINDTGTEIIDDVYISNRVMSVFNRAGDGMIHADIGGEATREEYLQKIFNITFYKKQEINVIERDNKYYFAGNENEEISYADSFLYVIQENNEKTYYKPVNQSPGSLTPSFTLVELSQEEDINKYRFSYQYAENSTIDADLGDRTSYPIDEDYLNTNAKILALGCGIYYNVQYQLKVVKKHSIGAGD